MGGHGAYPHKTKDPIVLSAEIINAWQTIASRENNPLDPIVVTVGSIHGGTKHNIIPDEVKMQLTVRTYKQEVRERVLAAIDADRQRIAQPPSVFRQTIARGPCASGGIRPCDLQQSGSDQTRGRGAENGARRRQCRDERSDHGRRRFFRIQFAGSLDPGAPCSQSAQSIRQKSPSRRKPASSLPSLHSSKFAPVPEPTIRTGIVGMTTAVLELMKK